ncbi:outer membrane beta-barrel protein [candidate division KSB1 bacterium]|nr:outer membrane beta-barrel protein [candidate division KSB1 bacterium]
MIRKQTTMILIVLLVVAQMSFAGGILTNTNQSVQYVRTLARNASTDLDAVYFNPAGLTELTDGWHVAFYSQTIFQEKKINNDFPTMTTNEFIGDITAPIFPDLFAVYKKDKLAFSFGIAPVAGGGSAEYADGLPLFEIPVSQLPAGLSQLGAPTTAYSADIFFKGSSAYIGYQLGVSYKINDMISVALGARYNMAKNTYEGHIKDIMINPTFPGLADGSMTSAYDFLMLVAANHPDPNVAGAAGLYAASVADLEVDAEQSGTGITPIIGVNLTLNEKLNVAVKYEMNTAIELENKTVVDGSGMFPDGAKFNNDIPAMLAVGAQYAMMPALDVALSLTYYFEQSADWEGAEDDLDGNSMEVALGLEYDINDAWLVSGGVNYAQSGSVGSNYQSDFEHDLGSITGGLGLRYKLSEKIDLDLGGLYTQYFEDEKVTVDPTFGSFTETYNRVAKAIAVGIGYHF